MIVAYFDDFPTDDDPAVPNGNGNLLDDLGFAGFNCNWSFLILFGFMVTHAIMALPFMCSPRKLLVKVVDANEGSLLPVSVKVSSAVDEDVFKAFDNEQDKPKQRELVADAAGLMQVDVELGEDDQSFSKAAVAISSKLTNVLSLASAHAYVSHKASAHGVDIPISPDNNPHVRLTVQFFKSRSGPIKHAPGVVLTFRDLKYSVPNPKRGLPDLQLLKGLSAFALPAEICALMGSSGGVAAACQSTCLI